MKSLYCAMGLLTRFPLPFFSLVLKQGVTPEIQAGSIKWFPLVGLLIGSILFGLAYYAQGFFSFIPYGELFLALGLLVVWIGLTGIIHLDGLTDCADGWVGGRDKKHTLDIMQDHTVGVSGIVVLVITLAVKFFALVLLLDTNFISLLLGLPIISRGFMALSLLLFSLAKEEGMAFAIRKKSNQSTVISTITFFMVSLLPLVYFSPLAFYAIGVGLLIALWVNILAWRRIGGITGDTCGAMIELTEAILPFLVGFIFYADWFF